MPDGMETLNVRALKITARGVEVCIDETINQNTAVLIAPIIAGTDWSEGWTVSVGGTTLRNFEGFENSTLTSSAATITYQADGSIQGGVDITLTVNPSYCPTGEDYQREIRIKPNGQSRSSHLNCP